MLFGVQHWQVEREVHARIERYREEAARIRHLPRTGLRAALAGRLRALADRVDTPSLTLAPSARHH